MIALIDQMLARGGRFRVPAGALAQAWRSAPRQVTLARFVRGAEVEVVPLDEGMARASGELLAVTGTSDVIDASVALVARMHGATIVTSDVKDLARLDPRAVLVKV